MPQQQLVQYIQRADALVLYSRFETFGCVIIEANACGVPVIVSDIPVLHENVTNGFNGLFAANENAVALADRIIYFIKNKQMFSKEEIARCTTEKYSYGQIGAQITAWYKLHRQAHSNY
jgi:glycosyltransferase involved in cell wall biosynthesis